MISISKNDFEIIVLKKSYTIKHSNFFKSFTLISKTSAILKLKINS